MKTTPMILLLFAGVLLMAAPAARGEVVWHDPWLNWDFINTLTMTVNDFAIVVDDPDGTFNPDPNDPNQVLIGMPFPFFAVSSQFADYDGDGDLDTMLKWSGADVVPDSFAHGGLYMLGSGLVLDAFWSINGTKVGWSTPITYERTRIDDDPAVHMELTIASGFFKDEANPYWPNQEAGWMHIRTFVNIPAELLSLEDLNRGLELDVLKEMDLEVPPVDAETGLPIGYEDTIWGVPDSFFDVFLADIPPEFASPEYEALLYAEVVSQGEVVGQFWNLNPQSPEPAALSLLALGALALIRRRRRS